MNSSSYMRVGTFFGNRCVSVLLKVHPSYIEASFDQFDVTTDTSGPRKITLNYYLDFILPEIVKQHLS